MPCVGVLLLTREAKSRCLSETQDELVQARNYIYKLEQEVSKAGSFTSVYQDTNTFTQSSTMRDFNVSTSVLRSSSGHDGGRNVQIAYCAVLSECIRVLIVVIPSEKVGMLKFHFSLFCCFQTTWIAVSGIW